MAVSVSVSALRRAVAVHEAGHVVAAVVRGGSSLKSVVLSDRHGEGLTVYNSHVWDQPFVAFAGPWAEGRALWGQRSADDEYDGLELWDYVNGVLLTQPDDAAVINNSPYVIREVNGIPLAPQEIFWAVELERLWLVIQSIVQMLLAGETVTDAVVRVKVETTQEDDPSWP